MIASLLYAFDAGADSCSRRVLRAYVKEQSQPGTLPSMRFRGILPDGMHAYGATREEAEAKVWNSIQAMQSKADVL